MEFNSTLFNMHGSVLFIVIMVWACVFIYPQSRLDLFKDFALTIVSIFIGILLIDVFSPKYTDWFVKNNCVEEIQIHDPIEHVIPEKTKDVRFRLGFRFYQIAVYQETVDGEYTVEFFEEEFDEYYGVEPVCIPFKGYAREVKILPKKPGERDHVIRQFYVADLKDKNTGYVVDTIVYSTCEFYLSEEIAAKCNEEGFD